MFWSIVALVFSVLLDLFNLRGLTDHEKDLEILTLQGPDQHTPIPREPIAYSGQVTKREVLGGIINDYYCAPQPFSHSLN